MKPRTQWFTIVKPKNGIKLEDMTESQILALKDNREFLGPDFDRDQQNFILGKIMPEGAPPKIDVEDFKVVRKSKEKLTCRDLEDTIQIRSSRSRMSTFLVRKWLKSTHTTTD